MKIKINGKAGEGRFIDVDDKHYQTLKEFSWCMDGK